MNMDITAIILTKNEEKNIGRVLRSVAFCKDVLVVDDMSSDKTVETARKNNAKVITHESGGDFAKQRNFAMDKVQSRWVLFVDADEEVTQQLKAEIEKILASQTETAAFYIKRRDYWWGRELKYGEVLKARRSGIIRFMKKGTGQWKGKVHEVYVPGNSTVRTGRLDGYLNHYPHPELKGFISDINRYTSLRARELEEMGVEPSILPIIFYPPIKFALNYLLYLGFLDGAQGFSYAFLMSFHSFLVKAKLYQYSKIGDTS